MTACKGTGGALTAEPGAAGWQGQKGSSLEEGTSADQDELGEEEVPERVPWVPDHINL